MSMIDPNEHDWYREPRKIQEAWDNKALAAGITEDYRLALVWKH